MNVDDLKHFLEIEQGHSHVSRELCLEIMNECEPSTQLRKKEMLGSDSNCGPLYCRKTIAVVFDRQLCFGRSTRTVHFTGRSRSRISQIWVPKILIMIILI